MHKFPALRLAAALGLMLLMSLTLAGCVQPPTPVTVAARPVMAPTVAALEPLPLLPVPKPDPKLVNGKKPILAAQHMLMSLGYIIKKPDGTISPTTIRAILAFERDHDIKDDPRLTVALADRIREALEPVVHTTEIAVRPGDFLIYSDGEEEVASADRSTIWESDTPRALVAIRPAMGGWPAAAKAGLDWALTHALDIPATPAPLKWSSTGVEEQFEIKTYAALTPREAGLVGGDPASCRRFELKSDEPAARYPGIACRDPDGTWYIPHSTVRLARPAAGLSTGVKAAGKKKS